MSLERVIWDVISAARAAGLLSWPVALLLVIVVVVASSAQRAGIILTPDAPILPTSPPQQDPVEHPPSPPIPLDQQPQDPVP